MFNPRNVTPLFKVCTDIANEVADNSGFVSVRALLERFHTKLRLRPLLVEGMIGSIQAGNGKLPEWTVLIDSECYPGLEPGISHESVDSPLPGAFRFTVAHELAHSLAFRSGEFGVNFEGISDGAESKAALVKAIEEETDRLVPLLLCSERVLAAQLRELTGPLQLHDLTRLLRQSGMSRELLLNRLALSRALDRDGLWQRPHLREFGVAIGIWDDRGSASFRRWPVFLNFARLTPKGFLTIQDRERVPLEVAFGTESLVATHNRGEHCVTSAAGTVASPDAGQMTLEMATESTERAAGSSFLILARNRQIRAEIDEFERILKSRKSRETQ